MTKMERIGNQHCYMIFIDRDVVSMQGKEEKDYCRNVAGVLYGLGKV